MKKEMLSESQLKRNLTKFLRTHNACARGQKFCKGKTAEQVWKEHRIDKDPAGIYWWFNVLRESCLNQWSWDIELFNFAWNFARNYRDNDTRIGLSN